MLVVHNNSEANNNDIQFSGIRQKRQQCSCKSCKEWFATRASTAFEVMAGLLPLGLTVTGKLLQSQTSQHLLLQ